MLLDSILYIYIYIYTVDNFQNISVLMNNVVKSFNLIIQPWYPQLLQHCFADNDATTYAFFRCVSEQKQTKFK